MSLSILGYASTVYPQSTPGRLDFIESATTADDAFAWRTRAIGRDLVNPPPDPSARAEMARRRPRQRQPVPR
jgi:hypothetical protein